MAETSAPRVLVLEDEPLIAWDLQEVLERLGFEVVGPVSTCEAALELIWSKDIDAAILDLLIGDGTCEVVANELSLSGIPCAFASSFDSHPLHGRFPVAPIITKPADEGRIAAAVATLVQSPAR